MVSPALISAGATLAGGLLGNRSSRKAAQANINLQREFAQQGIRWKVADAKAAGIHPLYALGAATHSFSPVSVSDPRGEALHSMGQDIGRAMHATATAAERREHEARLAEAAMRAEGREIERHRSTLATDEVQRQFYAAQTARLLQNASGPPTPAAASGVSSGGVDSGAFVPVPGRPGRVLLKPSESISAARGDGSIEAASTPGFKRYQITPRFGLDLPGQQMSEALEGLGGATGGAVGLGLIGTRWGNQAWQAFLEWHKQYREQMKRSAYEAQRRRGWFR